MFTKHLALYPSKGNFCYRSFLTGCYLRALTQSVGRGEEIIHRQKKRQGLGTEGTKNRLRLNTGAGGELDAHVADDFTRRLRCLEWDGVQSQLVSPVSKFAPGLLVPCLWGRCARIQTTCSPVASRTPVTKTGGLVCCRFFSQLGVRDHWGLAKTTEELDPASCPPLEGEPWVEVKGKSFGARETQISLSSRLTARKRQGLYVHDPLCRIKRTQLPLSKRSKVGLRETMEMKAPIISLPHPDARVPAPQYRCPLR